MTPKLTFGIGLVAIVAVQETNAFVRGNYHPLQLSREPIGVCFASGDDDNSNTGAAAVGPKAQGRRRSSRSRTTTGPKSSTGPKSTGPQQRSATRRTRTSERPPPNPAAQQQQQQQQQSPPTPKEPFDGKVFVARQNPNTNAAKLDLRQALIQSKSSSGIRCVSECVECLPVGKEQTVPAVPSSGCFEYKSLDDLLPNSSRSSSSSAGTTTSTTDLEGFSLSSKFNADKDFRNDLRSAIRLDVFETTPFYANLPEKAKTVLLLPDSSLEGSWRIPEIVADNKNEENCNGGVVVVQQRMKHTTEVLNRALAEHFGGESGGFRFTGDDLFEALGNLCGNGASTHWIDIYGVQDRPVNHSWHLDAGRSPQNCRTLLWGFPPQDNYCGTGVFSHIVSLQDPFGSTVDIVDDSERSRMEPVLFEGTVEDEYIFRPLYEPGKELLMYRDIDVLHSAPDVAYRTSVMRFM